MLILMSNNIINVCPISTAQHSSLFSSTAVSDFMATLCLFLLTFGLRIIIEVMSNDLATIHNLYDCPKLT